MKLSESKGTAKKKIVSLAMAAIMTATFGLSSALAVEDGLYVKVGAGLETITDTATTNSGIGMDLGLGYNFNKYVGVESQLAVLNAVSGSTVSAMPISINVLGYLPVNDRVSLFGKVGEAESTVIFPGTYGSASTTVSGQTSVYGFGIATGMAGDETTYRLGFDHYDLGVGGLTLSSNYLSVSAVHHFNN